MTELKTIEEPVSDEIKLFKDDFTASIRSEVPLLEEAINKIQNSTGKHIRPLLVLLTAKACGKVTRDSINSAVFLELLHTASLIHDDVIDETKVRRGIPSLNAIFDNRIAVLVGDFILSTSLLRSVQSGSLKVISIVSKLGRALSEGEIKQMENAEETVLEEDVYLQVIRKKTAALLSACTEIGAISAGASDELTEQCRDFGEYIGYCFQIRDDIFDYYNDSNIGKPTGNDIREGKVTLPLLHALKTGEKQEVEKFTAIIRNKDFTHANVEALIQFAKDNGGIEYAQQRMGFYKQKALEKLQNLPESNSKTSLLQLADYIVNRTK